MVASLRFLAMSSSPATSATGGPAPAAAAGDAAPLDAFVDAWEGFFRAVRRARGRANARPPANGLSLAQHHLLAPLAAGGPQTISVLADAAAVAPPTATRMLDGLVRDGLATRRPSDADRRCVLVDLTPAGRDALAVTTALLADARARIAGSLTEDERDQAAALLRRLTLVVEEQLP
jgi:DNA-binding MarR family transcriptional regulator